MTLIEIEMAAYKALHNVEENNWRCMFCESLTKHTEEEIFDHLITIHGTSKDRLKKEQGNEIFLYPAGKGDSNGKSITTQ